MDEKDMKITTYHYEGTTVIIKDPCITPEQKAARQKVWEKAAKRFLEAVGMLDEDWPSKDLEVGQ